MTISSVMPVYDRSKLAFDHGEGVYLFDNHGKRYLDFAAGIAVNSLGHCHPHLVKALTGQATKLWHVSNLYEIPGYRKLADRLTSATFADTVFFCNSGTEAVECGIKLVRKYHDDTGNPGRYRIITFKGAFHGRTLAAASASDRDKCIEGFNPPVDGFDNIEFGDAEKVRRAITPETAAILIEPIQGEGGIRLAPESYLRELRAIADQHGLLLFFDEVQCGMGRTGKLFAHEWAGITPDVMATAKGIGGGFPLGACLATEKAAIGMSAGTHGSTYGGNPLAMAVGNAVADIIIDEKFLAGVRQISEDFRGKLTIIAAKYPHAIAEIRGRGLMLGIRLLTPVKQFAELLRGHGLLTVPSGENVLRLLPPLISEIKHIDEAILLLDAACSEVENG